MEPVGHFRTKPVLKQGLLFLYNSDGKVSFTQLQLFGSIFPVEFVLPLRIFLIHKIPSVCPKLIIFPQFFIYAPLRLLNEFLIFASRRKKKY